MLGTTAAHERADSCEQNGPEDTMGAEFNVAVIMLRNRSRAAVPPRTDIRRWLSESRFSVARFWSDATYGWVTFPRFDYFGWFDISLPTGIRRDRVVELAKEAAERAGSSMDPYTVFFTVVAGQGAPDTGAAGTGVVVNTTDPHSFATHELGHAMGYEHSFGIRTNGPVYGDPYCIMSARTFGGARPEFDLADKYRIPRPPGMPEAWLTGPPPARAMVHHTMPAALETAYGKVAHVYEGQERAVTLNIAGAGSIGAELVVFHPAIDLITGVGIGRVYVEYRMPSGREDRTLWDQGLDTSGAALDGAGIIVHVVTPTGDPATPIGVWYSGRIILPTTDLDVTVPTPLGPVTVSIDEVAAPQSRPESVSISFSRIASRSVNLFVESRESRVVTSTEMRSAPSLPGFTGTFTWERREVTRTTMYRPFVRGVGGAGPIQGGTLVAVSWSVGGVDLSPSANPRTVAVPLAGRLNGLLITYSINETTKQLTLSNLPADGSYSVPVVCTATASTDSGAATGSSAYSVVGLEEGWGEDYLRFQDWWNGVIHPIPIEILKPRWWLAERLQRAKVEIAAVEALNPELAVAMRQISAEQIRSVARL